MPSIQIPQGSPVDARRSMTQGPLIISGIPAAESSDLLGKSLLEAGALDVEGTYSCLIETHDWSALDVILKPSAVTGSITPVLNRLYLNRHAVRTATNGVACSAGVVQVISSTTVVGTQRFRLDIAVPASGSITFTPGSSLTAPAALAEYNGA